MLAAVKEKRVYISAKDVCLETADFPKDGQGFETYELQRSNRAATRLTMAVLNVQICASPTKRKGHDFKLYSHHRIAPKKPRVLSFTQIIMWLSYMRGNSPFSR